MNYYQLALQKYAEFTGRARRKEYWMFVLINAIITIVLLLIDEGIFGTPILQSIYSIAVLVPSLAITVRRLHDIGKSGWWYLIVFIPIVGFIWLIVLLATDSQRGENEWGSDPKENEFDDTGTAV